MKRPAPRRRAGRWRAPGICSEACSASTASLCWPPMDPSSATTPFSRSVRARARRSSRLAERAGARSTRSRRWSDSRSSARSFAPRTASPTAGSTQTIRRSCSDRRLLAKERTTTISVTSAPSLHANQIHAGAVAASPGIVVARQVIVLDGAQLVPVDQAECPHELRLAHVEADLVQQHGAVRLNPALDLAHAPAARRAPELHTPAHAVARVAHRAEL